MLDKRGDKMRRVLIPFLILVIILSVPNTSQVNYSQIGNAEIVQPSSGLIALSDAGSSGNDVNTVAYMSRVVSNLGFDISNSYTDPAQVGNLDLTPYQTAGWTIYAVEVNANTMTAIGEHETMGITASGADPIIISNDTGLVTDALYQQFYNQPHDGKLENYTFTYKAPFYSTSLNPAWLVVRSDFSDPSTNTTGWIDPFLQNPISEQIALHDCSGDNAILNASTFYYAVIDGTGMIDSGAFPWFNIIEWWSTTSVLGMETGYNLRGTGWDIYDFGFQQEAELNYTYTPWNKSSNAALTYAAGEQLFLRGNATALVGTSWLFTSASNNLTQIQFQSNQSVNIDYDLTLWYKRDGTAATNWDSQTPGPNVDWNATTSITYPVLTGTLEQFLNYTVQADWTPSAFYDGNTPVVGTHTKYGTTVHCITMTDGTWTLSSSAPNYVGTIGLTGVTDGKVSILTDMDIDATIGNGGTANLTVLQGGSSVYTEEFAVSGGSADFIWDIDSTTSGNGTHSIEVWWTNGTEAGYNTIQVFVFYPTTLGADDTIISAYAENTFGIGVNFDDDFLTRGLDDPLADVVYSFDGGVNTSLVDQTGGRWTATVSTAGKTDGTYQLLVYAEGYALENQSLTITVKLVYQTQALSVSWSPTNNIPYLNTTKLSITYRIMDGSNVTGATVNVTFQGTAYDMAWDPFAETYWIELTGENFTGVPATFNLNVSAWRAGYETQYDDTITITIGSQTGEDFDVVYNPSTLNISYIESLFIQVTYEYNSLPINSSTSVNITFNGGSPVALVYNPGSTKWEVTLQGSDYFGTWTINVTATANGYTTRYNSTTFIVHEDIPIVSNTWVGSTETTDYSTPVPFSVTVTDSAGTPINDANVSFTAFGLFNSTTTGIAGVYSFLIDPNETRGVESFTVTIFRTGYVTSQMNLNLTVEATTSLTLTHSSAEWEEWNITIEAEYMDTFYNTPITGALVNITLDGTLYILQYVDGVYAVTITLDVEPNPSYTIDAFASAQYAAYATDQSLLRVIAKDVLHIVIKFAPPQVVAGEFMEVRATLYAADNVTTIAGQTIHFEISVYFANGTVIHYTDGGMTDSTNTEGVATYGFDVPEGQIDALNATASFLGSRDKWNAEKTETTGVEISILALVMSFLMSDIGIMIILSIAFVGIVAAGYNRGVKPKKKAAKLTLENQLQMFKDLETVQHFMAVYLDRGTCVFYHPFTDERIQPDLISGFIAAITSVYGEIKGDGVRGTLEEIQYHGLRLNSYSGQYIIGILILEGEMTTLLRERLQFFVELFENQYDQDLDGWTGLVDCFDPEWVVSTLNSAFNYAWLLPHRFGPTQKVAKLDAKILDYIGAVRDERSEFYIKNLLSPLAETLDKTEPEVLDRLLLLQDRGVIAPIGIQTILQRQGLALVNGSDVSAAVQPTPADEPTSGELEFEELAEEEGDEPKEAVVQETEPDSMESFVQDVESLLVAKADDEKEGDDELDEFAKELRAKIGEDEDSED